MTSSENGVVVKETNISIFLKEIQPKTNINCKKHENCHQIINLFEFFDLPYGLEISLNFENKLQKTYFVPCLSAIQIYNKDSKLIFEYYETARPDLRLPFNETIEQLFDEEKKELLQEHSSICNEKSWFSVNWFPILFDNTTSNEIRGQILTYHKLSSSSLSSSFLGFYPQIFKKKFWFGSNENMKKLKGEFKKCEEFLKSLKVEHPDLIHIKKLK